MSAKQKSGADPVVLGLEYKLSQLPPEFQSAVRFATAHDRMVLVGYVEDENRVYLMTVENDAA